MFYHPDGMIMQLADDLLLRRYRHYLAGQRQLADTSIQTYLSDVRNFLDWCRESGEAPQAMDGRMFGRYVAYLLMEAPDRRSKSMRRGLKRTTVRCKLAAIRSFYAFLVQEGWFKSTPVPSGRSARMRVPRPLPSFLTRARVDRLMEACAPQSSLEMRNRAILELLYACGPRLAELHQLEIDDVDLMTCTLTVAGHRGQERNLPFGGEAWRWLRVYLGEVRPALARDDNPALWLNNRGGRLSRRTLGHIVNRYAAAAGLEGEVHPQTLRHSFASHLLDGGADIRVVQELLGHECAGSTEVYLLTTVEEHRSAYLTHHPMAKASASPPAARTAE